MDQRDLLLPWLSVLDNVTLGGRLRGDAPKDARALDLLDGVGLSANSGDFPAVLSGGMPGGTSASPADCVMITISPVGNFIASTSWDGTTPGPWGFRSIILGFHLQVNSASIEECEGIGVGVSDRNSENGGHQGRPFHDSFSAGS